MWTEEQSMSAPTLSGVRQLLNAPVMHSHLAILDGIGTKLLPESPACEPVHWDYQNVIRP